MNKSNLSPSCVFDQFKQINQIPRPSKHEEKMVAYLKDFAQKHGLEVKVDAVNNVIIRKPATKGMENRKVVILQSHTDMVCDKLVDVEFDFDKDPIQTYVDGDWMKAKGTTLGADDGIGCGKTTLLNILGLLDQPTIGRYLFNGRDVGKFSSSRKARIRNREIGFIFQNFNLVTNMTVLDNVVLPLTYRHGWNYKNLEKASQLLDAIGLKNREYFKPNQLSGGQMQRVAIARALISRPSIILADEPTGNLDSNNSRVIMDLLTELHKKGNTILMVTHNPELLKFASRVIYMRDGQIERDEELTETKAFKVTKRTISNRQKKATNSLKRQKRLTRVRRHK